MVYSPLSFQISKSGEASTIIDFTRARCRPTSPRAGSCSTNTRGKAPDRAKGVNALYGALRSCAATRTSSVKLISDLYEIPAEIAGLEYENTITNWKPAATSAGPIFPSRCSSRSTSPNPAA